MMTKMMDKIKTLKSHLDERTQDLAVARTTISEISTQQSSQQLDEQSQREEQRQELENQLTLLEKQLTVVRAGASVDTVYLVYLPFLLSPNNLFLTLSFPT